MSEVAFNWNKFPSSRLHESYTGDVACQYSPSISLCSGSDANNQKLPLEVLSFFQCNTEQCKCIYNKYCMTKKSSWICCMCLQENSFPDEDTIFRNYENEFLVSGAIQFTSKIVSAESQAYKNSIFINDSDIYVVLVDVLTDSSELNALKQQLHKYITQLPAHTHLLFVVLDSDKVYLENKLFPKIRLDFNKNSNLSIDHLSKKLFKQSNDKFRMTQFIYNLDSELEICLKFLNNISISSSKKKKGERLTRITGKSFEICFSLLKLFKLEALRMITSKISLKAKVLAFISGPCTSGPGKVIEKDLRVNFRNHSMLFEKFSNLNNLNVAMQFYTDLVRKNVLLFKGIDANNSEFNRFCELAVKCDIYAANLDETGVFEMQELCNLTGGKIILLDIFESDLFKFNLLKDLIQVSYGNATLKVLTSDNIKIKGIIGSLISLKNKNHHSSDIRIGEAATNEWLINSLISGLSTYHIFFSQEDFDKLRQKRSDYYFQFQLKFPTGIRIITVFKQSALSITDMIKNFDQTCFVEILSMELVYKNKNELKYDDDEIIKALNDRLTKILKHFGKINIQGCEPTQMNSDLFEYISKNDLVKPNCKLEFLPQLFYYLERSFIVRKYNISPDESTFYNNIFLQFGNTELSKCVIIPRLFREVIVGKDIIFALTRHRKDHEPKFALESMPIVSSILSIAQNNIFIFDNFFHVLIHYGSTIAYYRDLFIKHVSPDLKHVNLINIDIEKHIHNAIDEYVKNTTNIATLDPVICLFDTVDFCSIFQSIKQAKIDAFQMVHDIKRPIVPRFTETDENKSQARFLYSRLSPIDRYESENYFADNAKKLTEDVSLNDFYADICKDIKL